ncbi:GIY-YIG nuclease family protein [Nocardia sp. NEAU-G5]|uniref:GIY-YIG nuclease family protein n=1 Tax=Nocardia albiluteola TaxID=2842303 RepID=A0ABS6B1T8_9NOCA|nr:GIY-YIG nuclease family protein [Nocardia albiluteola]MBU3063750.1 GIY-YIG nuclease family protein [Nocardia albiluteola]
MANDGPEPEYRFTCYTVSGLGTVTPILAAEATLCGLYVLHFADGEAYVGQSVNVAARFSAHARMWNDIETLDFAPWPADDLDRAEDRLIELLEQTKELRNKQWVYLSADDKDDDVTAERAREIVLPWNRTARVTVDSGATSEHRLRYWELHRHNDYPALRAAIALYINETVPDPVNTQRYLWNISALPTRSKYGRRLMTLRCGNLETLFVSESKLDDGSLYTTIRMNVDVPQGMTDEDLSIDSDLFHALPGTYRNQRVWSWVFGLYDLIEEDINVDSVTGGHDFFDLAYSLNIRMMRRGVSRYAKNHNPDLADDVLAEAYRQQMDFGEEQ